VSVIVRSAERNDAGALLELDDARIHREERSLDRRGLPADLLFELRADVLHFRVCGRMAEDVRSEPRAVRRAVHGGDARQRALSSVRGQAGGRDSRAPGDRIQHEQVDEEDDLLTCATHFLAMELIAGYSSGFGMHRRTVSARTARAPHRSTTPPVVRRQSRP